MVTADGTVHVLEAKSLTAAVTHHHPQPVTSVVLSGDGLLATGCEDGFARVYTIEGDS